MNVLMYRCSRQCIAKPRILKLLLVVINNQDIAIFNVMAFIAGGGGV